MRKNKTKSIVPFSVLIEKINTAPIYKLMPIARKVCGTDYAVRFYYNKNHPKFYRNQEAFRHAIRRCVSINAFDHQQQIIDYLGLEAELDPTQIWQEKGDGNQ